MTLTLFSLITSYHASHPAKTVFSKHWCLFLPMSPSVDSKMGKVGTNEYFKKLGTLLT